MLAGFRVFVAPGALGTAAVTAVDRLRMLGAEVTVAPAASDGPLTLGVHGPGTVAEVVVRGDGRSEALVQAECGIMAVHGRAEADPRPLGVDYVGVLTGVAASQAVLALVLAGLRGGGPTRAELALERVALLAAGQYLAGATAQEDPERGGEAAQGRPPFVSADGVWFELEAFDAASWQEFWTALCVPARAVARSWRPFLLRYEHATLTLPRELHDATAGWPFTAIAEVGARTRMSICRVRTVAARRADPGFGAAPWELTLGPQTAATAAAQAGGVPDGAQSAGASAAQAGRVPDGPQSTAPAGELPLAGVHVVESTRRVQGPMASRVLAMLGATVTRIEPPGGDPLRGMPPMAGEVSAKFRVLNEGKRTVEIDFKTSDGRAATLDLVRGADVFLHNWAPGKAAALGLDTPHLQAVEPGLVCASATGWGDVLGATPPAGTDFTVQAHSGVADALATAGRPPRPTLMITLDVLGGFVAAEGVLAALVARGRSGGRGAQVTTSLLAAADPLLAHRSSGVEQVVPTEDGRVVLDPARAAVALGLTGADDVAKALLSKPSAACLAELRAAGVPAVPVCTDLATVPHRHPDAFDDLGCAVVRSPWTFA